MHLCRTSILKITVEKMAISPECFVCFWWDLEIWKKQSFNLTITVEGITQLLKSNFEQSKCKWRHQCHAFGKKGNFFWTCPLTHIYHKWQSYNVWFLRYETWWTEFFVILDCLLPFYPSKNQNFEKLRKTPGDIILQQCAKNHDHMLYCSWDMACDGCNYSFLAIFCPFTSWDT